MKTVNLEMIEDAAKRLRDVARETPVIPFIPSFGFSQTMTSGNAAPDNAGKESAGKKGLYLKLENLQTTGSFKIRGAYNKLTHLTPEERSKGVIACSAGNHAQGVAFSANRLGMRAVICMPDYAPAVKVEGTRKYGAEVVLVEGNYDDSAREAERLAKEKGYTFAHPFNDPYVIAGQGTIGLEILSQMPDVEQVLVPVGGGGLLSGVAVAIKALKPEVKVIGVQTLNLPSMFASLGLDEIRTMKDRLTIADGLHVLTPGEMTFDIVQKYADDIVTVRETEIEAAILELLEGSKVVAEGAGATGVAAYMFDRINTDLRTVAVISGGNMDISALGKMISNHAGN